MSTARERIGSVVYAMDLLGDSPGADPVNEILRAVRVRSTVYCRSLMRAPWGFGVQAHGNPAFHVVTEGHCWLDVEGEARQTPLSAGDLVILPAGPRHWMRDAADTPAAELTEILAEREMDDLHRLHYGGAGARTTLLCGGFGLEGGATQPILHALPTVVRIRGVADRPAPLVAATIAQIITETASDAPGSEQVLCRLADTLLTVALRAALSDLDEADHAGVLALRDTAIASAIHLIHRHPERAWTIADLAAEVALSRSAFAARFRKLVGESPQRYITRTRLAHAATLLHNSDAPLTEIAARAGYQTEFSFSKAFKRTFGAPPGAYRVRPRLVDGLTPVPDELVLPR